MLGTGNTTGQMLNSTAWNAYSNFGLTTMLLIFVAIAILICIPLLVATIGSFGDK
jgi:hypothetical protein